MTHTEFQNRFIYNPTTDRLGKGGFGEVFKAYDTYRDRWVAVKMAKVETDHESVRLSKEVELVNKLPAHPNIAYYEECYTFSSFAGEYDFGILQYYEAGNLQQLIDNNNLTFAQRQNLLTQLLDGIGFLHEQGIIHRDLKPANILIVKRGDEYIPKITDFGISKKLDINNSSIFSNSLAGAGTLSFASPEQLGSTTLRKNTDLWSFGVIAYWLLAGELPFNTGIHGTTSEAGRAELFTQIARGTLPQGITRINQPWRKLIVACLITDSEKRARNVGECIYLMTNPKESNQEKTKLIDNIEKRKTEEYNSSIQTETTPKKINTNRSHLKYISISFILILLAGTLVFVFSIPVKKNYILYKTIGCYNGQISSAALSHDSKKVLVAYSFRNFAEVYDVKNESVILTLEGHNDNIQQVLFSKDDRKIITASSDSSIIIWDSNSGKILHKLTGHNGLVYSIVLSNDGNKIISGSDDGTIKIWDVTGGRLLQSIECNVDRVYSVDICSKDQKIISCSGIGTIQIWDIKMEKFVSNIKTNEGQIFKIAFSPNMKYFASGGEDGCVKIWSIDNGEMINKFNIMKNAGISSISFSSDGEEIVAGSYKRIVIFNVKNKKIIQSLNGFVDFEAPFFDFNGSQIISGSNDGTVKFWKLEKK